MTLSPTPSAISPAIEDGSAAEAHGSAPMHPFQRLELQARAELRTLQAALPPSAEPHDDGLRALLGWDLGLSGDELP